MSNSENVALVTGASRGIGRAIALELGGRGFTVIGTATSQAGADNISAYLEGKNYLGKGYCTDVSSNESVSGLLTQIQEGFSVPTVVVNLSLIHI